MKNLDKIQAWALVGFDDEAYIALGSRCDFGDGHEHFQAVFSSRNEALKAKRLHTKFYRNIKVKKIEISIL